VENYPKEKSPKRHFNPKNSRKKCSETFPQTRPHEKLTPQMPAARQSLQAPWNTLSTT